MKTNGSLQYEYELLPELEPISDYQTFDLEFAERDLNFMVFAKVIVDVSVEHDGDDWNTPRTTTIKSKIHSLEIEIFDKYGYEVEDENYLIYDELLTFLQDYYEK